MGLLLLSLIAESPIPVDHSISVPHKMHCFGNFSDPLSRDYPFGIAYQTLAEEVVLSLAGVANGLFKKECIQFSPFLVQ